MNTSDTLTKRIFVYGSLRSGEYNNYILEGSAKIADGSIDDFELVSLGVFPAIIPSKGDKVLGEVWDANERAFHSIERMELGAGYVRKEVLVTTPEGIISGDVYVYGKPERLDHCPRVKSGDWVNREDE